ncbi:unnamed protein product [Orchesella dallaii]|uniref:Uncharacterized protein n=1 Tax=Orchesella dallaii TaxID=48710 RepID=A0ABP1PK23_9HEXA
MPEVTLDSLDALKNFPSSADAAKTSILTVKSTVLDTTALIACLNKCADSLEVLRLDNVSLPVKEKFKKRVTLPKLKSFYYSQVKADIDSKDKLEDYLDQLDAKTILFFDKKSSKTWELEEVWDLKVNITLIIDGWRILDVNHDELFLTCMLPQSDSLVANSPRDLTRLALYDVEITSDSHIPTSDLTHLTLYEVIIPNIPTLIKQCKQLEELIMYEEKDDDEGDAGKNSKKDEDDDDEDFDDEEGEEEEEDADQDDWTDIDVADLPPKSLKRLALGRTRVSAKGKGAATIELESLALENCKADQDSLKMLKAKRVWMHGGDPQPTATVLKRMTDASSTEFVLMNGFNWEAKDTNKKKMNELLKASSSSGELYSGEDKFVLEKAGSKWKGRKFEQEECMKEQFKFFKWEQFCTEETWRNWFEK